MALHRAPDLAVDGTVDSQGQRFRIAGVLMASNSGLAPASLTVAECSSFDDVVQIVCGEHVLDFVPLDFDASVDC